MTSNLLKHRMIAVLLILAVILMGMCNLYQVTDSILSYSNSALSYTDTTNSSESSTTSKPSKNTNSISSSEFDKRMDAINERAGSITDEIKASIQSDVRGVPSTKTAQFNGFLFLLFLSLLPLIIRVFTCKLVRGTFVDRMYLIYYIHNSDGEKGDRTSILMA